MGRSDLIVALFRLHNYLHDEKESKLRMDEDDEESQRVRPKLTTKGLLPESFRTTQASLQVRLVLKTTYQFRSQHNVERDSSANK